MSKTRVSHEYGADLCRGVQSGKIAFLDLVSGKITCNREKAGAAVALERQLQEKTVLRDRHTGTVVSRRKSRGVGISSGGLKSGRRSAPPRQTDAKQERNEQAGQRRFAGNGAQSGDRLPRTLGPRQCKLQPIERDSERRSDVLNSARHVGRGVDGAFGHAGRGLGLRRLEVHG